VSRHYLERNGLAATPAEIAEVVAYHAEFERRDRLQRARKLKELSRRLASAGPEDAQRARDREFHAVLTRLAQADVEKERAPRPDAAAQDAAYRPWIEMWKVNHSIYLRYGGVVALTRFGPDPQGARLALVEDYERRGLVRFLDDGLRGALLERLAAPPSISLPEKEVDFTPYWKRPIPPSYFPD
jgi:hypothetical protein